jgi:hypothetical protein
MPKHVTPKNLRKVSEKLLTFVLEDKEVTKTFCEAFDQFLDDLLSEDFFGTEGQCDPRGDRRND